MKNILVTGGAGFIGSNLIKSLIEKGFNVTALDNYSTGSKSNEIQDVNTTILILRKYLKLMNQLIYAFILLHSQEFSHLLRILKNL